MTHRSESPIEPIGAGPTGAALSRRSALRLLGAGAGMALLAACGPAGPAAAPTAPPAAGTGPTSAPPAAAGPTPAAKVTTAAEAAKPTAAAAATGPQPRAGGTLRLAIPADITSLDGHVGSTLLSITVTNMFDRLVAYDVKATPQPMLAESWEVTSDLKQVKLNLRKGVQFHSGREFTSDDAKWNLLRGQDPKAATGSYVNQANWFPVMETPDKYTLIMKSEVARPAVFDYLNVLNMMDRQNVEGPDAKTKGVGTGPFTFVEWAQGDHLTFAKNKNYWQSNRPYVDSIIVNVVRDVAAMSTRLEAGAQDAAYGLSVNEFLRFKDDPKFVALIPAGQQSGMCMGVNTLFAPTDNKKVRQALNYAADRKRFTDQVFKGIVRPLTLPWDPNSLAYEASKENAYPFDLDKAKGLLNEAGVTSAELDFLASPNTPEWDLVSQIYQSDLAKIGVKLNLIRLDQAAWLDQVNNRKYHGFWASTMNVGTGEPVSSLSFARATDPNSNNQGFKDERYTQLITTGASEPDAAKRKAIYSQINDILLDESFAMIIATYPPKMVTSAKLHDVVTPTSLPSLFMLTDAWLEP